MLKQKSLVIKSGTQSKQHDISADMLHEDEKIIEPYLNFDSLRGLYAFNVYHQRAIKTKAMLLSQIEESNLESFLPAGVTPQKFLHKFILNAETYGTAYFEKSTEVAGSFYLYNLNTYTARVDRHHNIFQVAGTEYIPLDGGQFMYDTILSDHYGEPDYLTVIGQIVNIYKADKYNGAFFDNGAKPEMAIMFKDSDPSEEQIAAIQSFFKKDLKGYTNAHKTLLLTTGEGNGENKPDIEIKEMGKVEDLSFEKLKMVGRDEIIVAHNMPPKLMGVTQSNASLSGGSELLAQLKMFNTMVLEPKARHIETFFAGHGITLKIKSFDVEAFKDDTDAVASLVGAGVLTPTEAKNVLGWSNGD